jgi:endoglucanase
MRTEPRCLSAIRRGLLFFVGSGTLLVSACGDLATAPDLAASTPHAAPPSVPAPPRESGFAGRMLYVDPGSSARKQAEAWRVSRPADAAQMEKIASQPHAIWFGDWTPRPYDPVGRITRAIVQQGALPVYVLYNIPLRDCGLHSRGGAASAAAYQDWIVEVVRGIAGSPAVVILEPDAVAGLECLSPGDQEARLAMLRQAVRTLKAAGGISVYIDAGNARWQTAELIAARLAKAGIEEADGFALNVSNFLRTEDNLRYGETLSRLVGGKHFVIDTSRNGSRPSEPNDWRNAPDRGLGARPTTRTGHPLVDAFLWIKTPGESDGECNGGPRAGDWWPEYALTLARNAQN